MGYKQAPDAGNVVAVSAVGSFFLFKIIIGLVGLVVDALVWVITLPFNLHHKRVEDEEAAERAVFYMEQAERGRVAWNEWEGRRLRNAKEAMSRLRENITYLTKRGIQGIETEMERAPALAAMKPAFDELAWFSNDEGIYEVFGPGSNYETVKERIRALLKKIMTCTDAAFPPLDTADAKRAYLGISQDVSELLFNVDFLSIEDAEEKDGWEEWEKTQHIAYVDGRERYKQFREALIAAGEPLLFWE